MRVKYVLQDLYEHAIVKTGLRVVKHRLSLNQTHEYSRVILEYSVFLGEISAMYGSFILVTDIERQI